MIRRMKFRRAAYQADWLVALALDHQETRAWFGELPERAMITAIPMPGLREIARGFNQSALLAEALSKALGRPLLPAGALVRTDFGLHRQARAKTPAERRTNLRGVFRIKKPNAVIGQQIVLVDDVTTTGATLDIATQELLRAGAAEVFAFAISRAGL